MSIKRKFRSPLAKAYPIGDRFGGKRRHKGVDFKAPAGTRIRTARKGKVIRVSSTDPVYGNIVEIEHEAGVVTIYAHKRKRSTFKVGKTVGNLPWNRIVGSVGSSGIADGPHLHFGVRVDGDYVDPLTFLAQHR